MPFSSFSSSSTTHVLYAKNASGTSLSCTVFLFTKLLRYFSDTIIPGGLLGDSTPSSISDTRMNYLILIPIMFNTKKSKIFLCSTKKKLYAEIVRIWASVLIDENYEGSLCRNPNIIQTIDTGCTILPPNPHIKSALSVFHNILG